MKTYEDFEKAINFGNQYLPRIGFFELAKLLGISETTLMSVIMANKDNFSVAQDKTISVRKRSRVEFLSTTESYEWFLKNCCGGVSSNVEVVYTNKTIAASISAPIAWERGDFGFAIKVTVDINSEGAGAKAKLPVDGPINASRLERLGRVTTGGGSATDKWIFGVVLKPDEIAAKAIGDRKLFLHAWAEEVANSQSEPTWVWPSLCETQLVVDTKPDAKRGRPRKEREQDSAPEDIPGQQVLEGTSPKPVEISPPASILKPSVPVAAPTPIPPPPMPPPPVTTSESLKQEIRSRAVGDAVAAGTIPPGPPPVGGPAPVPPPNPAAEVAKSSVPSIGELLAKVPGGQAILPKVEAEAPITPPAAPAAAIQAINLLDSLLSKTGQK